MDERTWTRVDTLILGLILGSCSGQAGSLSYAGGRSACGSAEHLRNFLICLEFAAQFGYKTSRETLATRANVA